MPSKKMGLIGLAVCLALSFLGFASNARADYWTRHTRESSGNTLPQYFELENMAKSSLGMRFFYGTDRQEMAGVGVDDHNLISFDGTNWTDQTSAAETIGNYNDLEFQTMYADENGNVWMPNRRDSNRPLLKYNGLIGQWEVIPPEIIAGQLGLAGGLKINNLFTGPNNNIYAVADNSNGQLRIIYYDGTLWHDTGISGGPLGNYGSDMDIYGIYSSMNNGSYWLYKYHSSENEYANPAGGDQGAGLWRYQDGSWTHYDSGTLTASGTGFVNGITESFVDSTGKVWVGSRHGVFRYDGTDWINWTKDNGNIFTNRVIRVQEDSAGKIWIVALENENETDDHGGISIYNPSDNSWDYYTSYNGEDALNNATNIFMIGSGSEAWMFTGHGESAMSAGIYQLARDSAHTAVYGQTSGSKVDMAGFDPQKKNSNKVTKKKVTIWKLTKVKKKWKKRRISSSTSTNGWYKQLNLDTGKYRVKVGKKKRTINITSGEPYRLNLR